MPILPPKTALNRPPEFCTQVEILWSDNAHSALNKLQWCSKQTPPRILCSENGNSVLKKWKLYDQNWKFWAQEMENFRK